MVLTLCACATTGQGSPLRVPDVRQTTDYTCSASALQAVLAYFGEEAGEPELASELGATPQDGAPPEAIVRVARAHGLSAELREDLRIADLASAVRRGIPVIVALQAERGAVEPGFVIREAVRRVVQLRQHLDSIDQTHTG